MSLKQKEEEYYRKKYPELYQNKNTVFINENIYKYNNFKDYFSNQYPDIVYGNIYDDSKIKEKLNNVNFRNSQNYIIGKQGKSLIKTGIDFGYYKGFNNYFKNQSFKNNKIKEEITFRKRIILFLLIINIFYEIIQISKGTFFNNFQFFLTVLLLLLGLLYYSGFFFKKKKKYDIFINGKEVLIVNLKK